MYSSIQLNNSGRNRLYTTGSGLAFADLEPLALVDFLVLFCLFLVSTKEETQSAALVTHMVQ